MSGMWGERSQEDWAKEEALIDAFLDEERRKNEPMKRWAVVVATLLCALYPVLLLIDALR
jgi:hypothetical protein